MEEKTIGKDPAVQKPAKINLFAEKTLKKAASAVLAESLTGSRNYTIGCNNGGDVNSKTNL